MPQTNESELAEALAALVQQIDISDYRDKRGNAASNNVAFIHAQQLVDRYGCTHDQICDALERYGDDMAGAARQLAAA
jgi:hypothetical protein